MIKIGITYRLFLSILAATCLAILCMFLIMQWNIDRGFLQYLNSIANESVESMSKSLGESYGEHGDWDFMRRDPLVWVTRAMNARNETTSSGTSKGPSKEGEVQSTETEAVKKAHLPKIPLVVLDAEHKPVFGNPEGARGINYKPIVHKDRAVGYVGLLPPKQFLSHHQLQFLRGQKLAMTASVFGLILLVIIFSLPLARRLVRPVKAMAAATKELASGKYTVRVPVTSSDELGSLARSFNMMAMELEKNEKARRQWVADISHELRTPLSVLRGEIEALLEGVRDTTPEAIRSLHSETVRLGRLVDDLHQLTLSDLGALTYHKEDLDPGEILLESAENYKTEYVRKNIGLTTDISGEAGQLIFADRERLYQLFANLFDNSLKYTDEGGYLTVRLRHTKGQVMIEFEDTAPGVADDDIKRIFERLYRVEESRNRSSGGAGLGLAICRNIVEAHSGTISAHTSPSGGILVRIVLPATELKR